MILLLLLLFIITVYGFGCVLNHPDLNRTTAGFQSKTLRTLLDTPRLHKQILHSQLVILFVTEEICMFAKQVPWQTYWTNLQYELQWRRLNRKWPHDLLKKILRRTTGVSLPDDISSHLFTSITFISVKLYLLCYYSLNYSSYTVQRRFLFPTSNNHIILLVIRTHTYYMETEFYIHNIKILSDRTFLNFYTSFTISITYIVFDYHLSW